jgi:hypothetical protein
MAMAPPTLGVTSERSDVNMVFPARRQAEVRDSYQERRRYWRNVSVDEVAR